MMNENNTIYQFLATRGIDYVNCPISTLLEVIEGYFHFLNDENQFSDQMLILSKNVEENRSGVDAIRLNMKSLELLSPQSVFDTFKPEAKSDS
ncbi:MAG: hypothetical protein H6564_02155 [Lewinellaceae bacterium]|nr:hypothetical protein [Lewinellaceae bacterium]